MEGGAEGSLAQTVAVVSHVVWWQGRHSCGNYLASQSARLGHDRPACVTNGWQP